MWYEGEHQIWNPEPNEETVAFWYENEGIVNPDLSGIDDKSVWDESQEELDYFLDNTQLPWIQVPIDVPWKDIYEEAHHLLHTACFTLHRPNSAGWLSLAIHGMSSTHTNVPGDYGLPDSAERDMSDWTDIAKFCPRTKEWMQDTLAYEFYTRARFMAVLPGGWLGVHRDRERTRGIGATNVAINNPDGCKLMMGGFGELPYTPGSVFKINTGYEHAVWNQSDEPRIHMIFDGSMGDYFKGKALEGYGKMLGYT